MTIFTRQHHNAIADLLYRHRPVLGTQPPNKVYWSDIVEEFVMLLRHDNFRFDEDKFKKICSEGDKER